MHYPYFIYAFNQAQLERNSRTLSFFREVNSQNSSIEIKAPFFFLYFIRIWASNFRAARSLRPVIFMMSFA